MNWTPPDHWLRITSIDAHTGGEPLRIITSGFPDLQGSTILEKRQYARTHYDHLRRALMWEPRGGYDMYAGRNPDAAGHAGWGYWCAVHA